ncbi:MAG: MFS transporter [Chloroflexota bacterium]
MDQVNAALHNRGFQFALRYNIFAIALSTFWTPIEVIILQQRITDTTSLDFRAAGLGIVTFVGIGIAALTEPIAGRISDLGPWADRRRPFIVGGAAVTLVFLGLFWWAPSYYWLFAAYVLMQLSSNFSQAGFQALIPDLAAENNRGLSSGVKNGYDVLGSAIGLIGVGTIIALGLGTGYRETGPLAFIAIVYVICAILTILWVPTIGPLPQQQRPRSLGGLINFRALASSFTFDLNAHRGFALAIAIRFLFLLGMYPVERFFLFFIQDRYNLSSAATIASYYAVGILLVAALAALGAGFISDRVGRRITLAVGIVVSVIGIIGIAFSPTLLILAGAAVVAAIGLGTFQAANWALIADHIPNGRGARFFGLANVATAGASAIAGLTGLGVSALRSSGVSYTYELVFTATAIIALTSLIPLYFLTPAQASGDSQ